MSLTLELAGLSDVGRLRRRNEDAFVVVHDPPLAVVADGMGGHPAGDVASALAVRAVRETLTGNGAAPASDSGDSAGATPPDSTRDSTPAPSFDPLDERSPSPLGRRMLEAVDFAERSITDESERDPERRGMGTTLTALVVREDGHWAIGHVGDSRAYRWAGGSLEQLTRDHTWVQEQVDRGAIAPEDAHGHPWGHILAQALGTGSSRPQLVEGRAHSGDVYLLCTDGLTAMLSDDAMERILEEALPRGLDAAAGALVEAANEHGGADNITVALLAVGTGAREAAGGEAPSSADAPGPSGPDEPSRTTST